MNHTSQTSFFPSLSVFFPALVFPFFLATRASYEWMGDGVNFPMQNPDEFWA